MIQLRSFLADPARGSKERASRPDREMVHPSCL